MIMNGPTYFMMVFITNLVSVMPIELEISEELIGEENEIENSSENFFTSSEIHAKNMTSRRLGKNSDKAFRSLRDSEQNLNSSLSLVKLFQLGTIGKVFGEEKTFSSRQLLDVFGLDESSSLRVIKCSSASSNDDCQKAASSRCILESRSICLAEKSLPICRYAFLKRSFGTKNCCYKINCLAIGKTTQLNGNFLVQINGQDQLLNFKSNKEMTIPKSKEKSVEETVSSVSKSNILNHTNYRNVSQDLANELSDFTRLAKRSTDPDTDSKSLNTTDQTVFLYDLNKASCIEMCHSKTELSIAAQNCAKRNISCTAKHDCPAKDVCQCLIIFTCEKNYQGKSLFLASRDEDENFMNEIFKAFRGISNGGSKTVNLSSTASSCGKVCDSKVVEESICKHGSSCNVKSGCYKMDECQCSVSIKCYKEAKKKKLRSQQILEVASDSQEDVMPRLEGILRDLKSPNETKSLFFNSTTSDKCTQTCRNKALSNNSCDYGLSCQAKSQCVQSIETTCNCSVVLRCKTSHESGLKKSETEIGRTSLESYEKVMKSLKSMDFSEQRTLKFNSDMEQCSSICMSKELKEVCQAASTCDAKSVCQQNKHCECTLKFSCSGTKSFQVDQRSFEMSNKSTIPKDSSSASNSVKYEEDSIRKAFSEVSGGGIRTINMTATEEQCNTLCEEFDLKNTVCKSKKSTCKQSSDCSKNELCSCKVTLDCGLTSNFKKDSSFEVSMEGSYNISKIIEQMKTVKENETKKIHFISTQNECQETCEKLDKSKGLCPTGIRCFSEPNCQKKDNCNCTILFDCKSSQEIDQKGVDNDEDYLSITDGENGLNGEKTNQTQPKKVQFGSVGYNLQTLVDFLKKLKSHNRTVTFESNKQQCLDVCKELKNGQNICKNGAICMTQSECTAELCNCTLRLLCKTSKGVTNGQMDNETSTTSDEESKNGTKSDSIKNEDKGSLDGDSKGNNSQNLGLGKNDEEKKPPKNHSTNAFRSKLGFDSEVPQDEQKNDEATGEFEKESKIKNIKKEVGENKVMSSKGKEDDKSSDKESTTTTDAEGILVTKRKTSTSPKLNDGRDDNSDPVKSGKQQKSNSSESTTEDKKDSLGDSKNSTIISNVTGSVTGSEFHPCDQLCLLVQFDESLCQGGYNCQSTTDSRCNSANNCTCSLLITCREVNREKASFNIRKGIVSNSSYRSFKGGDLMESNSSNSSSSKSNQMDSSILQALESLRTIDLSGNKTVNFNTSHDHCSELCESPRLATETCQYGSSCKVKSSRCSTNSLCNCSLTLSCHEVSEEFKRLVPMNDESIRNSAMSKRKVSSEGLLTTNLKFRVKKREECSESCKPMISGACGSNLKLNASEVVPGTIQQGGKCKFVFQCTGRNTHEICMCSVTATCDRNEMNNSTKDVTNKTRSDVDYSTNDESLDSLTQDEKSSANKKVEVLDSLTEIPKSAKNNLRSDGSTEVRFAAKDKAECSSSCKMLLEGACGDTGGVCDYVLQCSSSGDKEVEQSTDSHYLDKKTKMKDSAKSKLENWKSQIEKSLQEQNIAGFHSSSKSESSQSSSSSSGFKFSNSSSFSSSSQSSSSLQKSEDGSDYSDILNEERKSEKKVSTSKPSTQTMEESINSAEKSGKVGSRSANMTKGEILDFDEDGAENNLEYMNEYYDEDSVGSNQTSSSGLKNRNNRRRGKSRGVKKGRRNFPG